MSVGGGSADTSVRPKRKLHNFEQHSIEIWYFLFRLYVAFGSAVAMVDTALLNRRATRASALPKTAFGVFWGPGWVRLRVRLRSAYCKSFVCTLSALAVCLLSAQRFFRGPRKSADLWGKRRKNGALQVAGRLHFAEFLPTYFTSMIRVWLFHSTLY